MASLNARSSQPKQTPWPVCLGPDRSWLPRCQVIEPLMSANSAHASSADIGSPSSSPASASPLDPDADAPPPSPLTPAPPSPPDWPPGASSDETSASPGCASGAAGSSDVLAPPSSVSVPDAGFVSPAPHSELGLHDAVGACVCGVGGATGAAFEIGALASDDVVGS